MAGAAHCSLQAKRLLLDPKFEGYKLSLEPLACYQLGLDAGEERARRGAGLIAPGIPWAARGGRIPPRFPSSPRGVPRGRTGLGLSVQGAPSWGSPARSTAVPRLWTAGVSETERFISAILAVFAAVGRGARPSPRQVASWCPEVSDLSDLCLVAACSCSA